MLPSTGLFKAITCPFYEARQCVRPFCHYKHVRKDATTTTAPANAPSATNGAALPISAATGAAAASTAGQQPPPPATLLAPIQILAAPAPIVYRPTPKHILAKSTLPTTPAVPQNATNETNASSSSSSRTVSSSSSGEPTKKRIRLEYVPTSKSTGQNHYGKNRGRHSGASADSDDAVAGTELPASAFDDAESDPIAASLVAILSGVAEADASANEAAPTKETTTQPDVRKEKSSADRTALNDQPDDTKIAAKDSKAERSPKSHHDKERKKLHEHNSKSSKSSATASRSSSASHRHRKSSTENAHHRSASSTSRHKSSSSSSSHKSSSRSSGSHSTSARKHSSSKSSSKPSSSSSAASKVRSTGSSHKATEPPAGGSPSSTFDSENDEESIMEQCRMIFDETPQPVAETASNAEQTGAGDSSSSSTKKSADELAAAFEESLRKRRVAYDGAATGRPAAHAPGGAVAKNHTHAAMASVFQRQEIVRIQLEKMEAAKAAEREAKEKRLAALEAERVARAKAALARPSTNAGTSSGSSSTGGRVAHSSASGTSNRRVSLVSAASSATSASTTTTAASSAPSASPWARSREDAMQRAKQKVEEMRAARQPTILRTVPKGSGRIAHAPPTMATASMAAAAGGKAAAAAAAAPEKPRPIVLESHSTKISLNLRMQYYTLMAQHCRNIYRDNADDAWERAQAVELGVFNKCNTPVIYKKSATLAVNSLRKEAIMFAPSTEPTKTISHEAMLGGRKAQTTSWSVQKPASSLSGASKLNGSAATTNPLDNVTATKAFDMIYELRLSDELLHSNGFPRPAERAGWALIHRTHAKARPNNPLDRYCARCGTIFNIAHFDDDTVVDACNYHAKSPGFLRGSNINAHRCCQQPSGSPGCMYANHHVTDYVDTDRLTGFVRTFARNAGGTEAYRATRDADIFALDCEMCYTTQGLELTRVTVVNFAQRTVYDALVRPDNKVIDYNTTYSGITAQMLEREQRTLRDVQAVLLSMFHARTVLIGHSLDSDLKALRLIHDVVVDTSVLYPHKMGPPKKRALKTLCIENLGRIIQESEAGHDSAEDAEVCIALVRHYLQNKIV